MESFLNFYRHRECSRTYFFISADLTIFDRFRAGNWNICGPGKPHSWFSGQFCETHRSHLGNYSKTFNVQSFLEVLLIMVKLIMFYVYQFIKVEPIEVTRSQTLKSMFIVWTMSVLSFTHKNLHTWLNHTLPIITIWLKNTSVIEN